MVRMKEMKEGMHLYVSYVITLDTQRDFAEWIGEISIGILATKGTITKMTEEMIMVAIAV